MRPGPLARCFAPALLLTGAACVFHSPPPLVPGQRVRVTAPEAGVDRLPGTLVRLTADTIVLVPERAAAGILAPGIAPMTLARRAVLRLERSDGRHGHFRAGTALGMLAGGVAAAAVGYLTFHEDRSDTLLYQLCGTFLFPFPCPPRITRGEKALADGVFGAALGGTIGGVVGLFVRTERWVPLPLDRLSVTVRPLMGGATGVGLSFALRIGAVAGPRRRVSPP